MLYGTSDNALRENQDTLPRAIPIILDTPQVVQRWAYLLPRMS
jgi:hypothetical protein